ncbi:MAG: pyridoxal 5'-phosphate synthase glutaminase subunit PdxT [Candidatus Marinimicrobia bacterium]|nr:pyridoxal 5'-phosphate synthase glutaminase subunit PdxT [Candidatus Neomarinimicrobiota bacterium]
MLENNKSILIGILGIQGAYLKHQEVLESLSVKNIIVKYSKQLDEIDGLIIPGGETTAFTKQMNGEITFKNLKRFAKENPTFGTCAGLITQGVGINDKRVLQLEVLDATIERNAYGTQIESFIDEIDLNFDSDGKPFQAIFIRAPKIIKVGKDVKILANLNNKPVLIENELHLGASFHPELTDDFRIHKYFIEKVEFGLATNNN